MGDHTPRRKASIASSASSGATIKPTNRQNSGSNGFFARFRSASQSRSADGDDVDGEGNGWEPEAGPSDYYRRSPSPPPPPLGWRTASTEVYTDSEEEEQRAWEGPYDSWNPNWRDEQSDAPTPDGEADESMSLDMEEYQKRLRDVLNGSRVDTPEPAGDVDDSEGTQDNGVERLIEKTGIGEEEFGISTPSSSPPSTPQKTARQVSYIRKSSSVCLSMTS